MKWSRPNHYGQVQINLVRPKPFWTDQNCFGHIEGQGSNVFAIRLKKFASIHNFLIFTFNLGSLNKDFIFISWKKETSIFFEAHMYLVSFSVFFKKLSQPKMLTIINNLRQIKTRGVKGKIQWNEPLPKLSALKYYSFTVVEGKTSVLVFCNSE